MARRMAQRGTSRGQAADIAPSGQCAHGPPPTACQLGDVVLPPDIANVITITCLLAGMNKDNPLRIYYQQAHDAAVVDTIQFATDVLLNSSNIPDNVCMVMTDEKCPRTVKIGFDDVLANPSPVVGAPLRDYLAKYGISIISDQHRTVSRL
jgi:hypothetical protein